MGLERQDIVTDEALKTIPELTQQMTDLLNIIDQVKVSSKGFSDGLGGNGTLPKAKSDTEGLTQAQVELNKVQTQLSAVVARQNDTWIANSQALKNAKDELKNSQATADNWTRSANAQNSSITKLTEALDKNRVAYAALNNEQARSSEKGKALLSTIQEQDKSIKQLRDSMGQHQAHVGDYGRAVEGLKEQFEGLISKLGPAGEKIEEIGGKSLDAGKVLLGVGEGLVGVVTAAAALIGTSLAAYFTRTSDGAKELFVATTELEFEWNEWLTALSRTGGLLVSVVKNTDLYKEASALLFLVQGAGAKDFEKNALNQRQLVRDRVALTTEESKLELEKNELIFKSRNKLNFTDEERLEFNREAYKIQIKISEDAERQAQKELTAKTREILMANQERGITKLSIKDYTELNELQQRVYEARKARFDGTRRIQAQEVQISEEIHKREIDDAKAELEVDKKISDDKIKSDIQTNNDILANLKTTLQQREEAIKANQEDEKKLAENARNTALENVRLAAQERIRSKVGATVFDSTPEQQKFVLDNDKQLTKERIAIQLDFQNQVAEINSKATAAQLNLAKEGERQEIEARKVYDADEKERLKIKQSNEKAYWDEVAKDAKEGNDKIDQDAKDEFEKEKKLAHDKTELRKKVLVESKRIALELANTIEAIGDAQYNAELAQSQARLDLLSSEHEKSIKAAGDNKNAIAAIDRKYTQDLAVETERQNAIKRKQAQFDKIAAEFKVISSTAAAIAQAYDEFPYPVATVFAALIGVVSALQLAAIDAAPLPYEHGTSNHPGGPALVAEAGTELVMEPGGRARLYDVPNTYIPNLPAGSKVYTADDTRKILQAQAYGENFSVPSSGPMIVPVFDDSRILAGLDKLAGSFPDMFEQLGEVMKAYNKSDGSRQIVRSKWTY